MVTQLKQWPWTQFYHSNICPTSSRPSMITDIVNRYVRSTLWARPTFALSFYMSVGQKFNRSSPYLAPGTIFNSRSNDDVKCNVSDPSLRVISTHGIAMKMAKVLPDQRLYNIDRKKCAIDCANVSCDVLLHCGIRFCHYCLKHENLCQSNIFGPQAMSLQVGFKICCCF